MTQEVDVKIYKLASGQYMCSYHHPRTLKRVRNKFKTEKEAKQHKEKILQELQNLPSDPRAQLFVNQLIKIYLEEFPNSSMRERLYHFEDFCDTFGKFLVTDINRHNLRDWMLKRKELYMLHDRTMLRLKYNLNGFFKFLVEEEIILKNPLDYIKFSNSAPSRRKRTLLSVDEINEILDKAKGFSPRVLYPALYALAHTGARKGEVLKLQWKHIDLNNKVIHFYNTKNGDDRTIKMTNNLYKFLLEKSKETTFVFLNTKDREFTPCALHKLVLSFQEHHTFSKVWRIHDLRHSFAYNFLKQGGNMYQLKAVLGHKSIQMTIDLYGKLEGHDVDFESPYDHEENDNE